MPNANYVKGRKKEYKIVNRARALGLISFRSAGSHSPIDVVIIDKEKKIIGFVQCKPKTMSNFAKNKLMEQQKELSGSYMVSFDVV